MLAWIDLEMTGLDPDENVVVEIATLITNDELEIIAEGPDLVIHATEEDLAKMDSFVVDMHTKSGLLPEIRNSNISVEEAEKQTMAFLNEHIKKCTNTMETANRLPKWMLLVWHINL